MGDRVTQAPSAHPQVREHLLPGLQHGRHVPVCVQQHRDCAHLQTRNCEGKVSYKDTFVSKKKKTQSTFSTHGPGDTPTQALSSL